MGQGDGRDQARLTKLVETVEAAPVTADSRDDGVRVRIRFAAEPESTAVQMLLSRGFAAHDGLWYGIVSDPRELAAWAGDNGAVVEPVLAPG